MFNNSEAKLAGWTVFADLNSDGVLDVGEVSAVTDANGDYSLDIDTGSYAICEVMQSGWTQTYPWILTATTCHTGTASNGQTIGGLNFGNMNEHEGTIGFWRNWNKHNKYTATQIDGWLAAIDSTSAWLMVNGTAPATSYTANVVGMVTLINDATKDCDNKTNKDLCAKRKFWAQYMVNQLNVASGKKSLTSTYNLSGFGAAMSYLVISPTTAVTLGQYITAVELKALTSPNRNQFMLMMSVSDYINNQGI